MSQFQPTLFPICSPESRQDPLTPGQHHGLILILSPDLTLTTLAFRSLREHAELLFPHRAFAAGVSFHLLFTWLAPSPRSEYSVPCRRFPAVGHVTVSISPGCWVLCSGHHSCIRGVRQAVFSSEAQGHSKHVQVTGNMRFLRVHRRIRTLSSTAQYPAVDFGKASRGGAALNRTGPRRMIFLFLNSDSATRDFNSICRVPVHDPVLCW